MIEWWQTEDKRGRTAIIAVTCYDCGGETTAYRDEKRREQVCRYC